MLKKSKPNQFESICTSPVLFAEPAHRLRVRQRPEPVVVLLTRRVPQTQVDRLPIHHHVGWVVIKPAGGEVGGANVRFCLELKANAATAPLDLHCGDVLPRKGVGGVADEQTCFPHSPEMRKDSTRTVVTCKDFSWSRRSIWER